MAQQAKMLSKVEKELLSYPNSAKGDDIELQEITENAARSMGNLIEQFKGLPQGQETLPMCELQGLDKQLRSIRGFTQSGGCKKG